MDEEKEPVLVIDLWKVPDGKPPYQQVADLGISYETWRPRPIADSIVIGGCKGLPNSLPKWLRRMRKP